MIEGSLDVMVQMFQRCFNDFIVKEDFYFSIQFSPVLTQTSSHMQIT